MNIKKNDRLEKLCEAFLTLKSEKEVLRFLKDLCTPNEIDALAERWQVCRLLEEDSLSYRDIHKICGVSLTTIGRVARFLKQEPHKGYLTVLNRLKKENL